MRQFENKTSASVSGFNRAAGRKRFAKAVKIGHGKRREAGAKALASRNAYRAAIGMTPVTSRDQT